MSDITLLGLCGSLRAGSCNRKLMHEAARHFGEATFVVGDLNLPLYNGDDEDAHGIPDAVQRLSDQIAAADAVVIATPEYNGCPPGVLKNALDWVSRTKPGPWKGKPVAIVSAADGRAGGAKSQVMLRTMMLPFRTRILQGPEVMVADCSNQFDAEGRLVTESYEKLLSILMRDLRAEIGR